MKNSLTNMRTIPVLPVKNTVLYPYLLMPIVLSRRASQDSVEAAMASEDKYIVVCTQRNAEVDEPKEKDLYKFGTLAVIKNLVRIDGSFHIFVQGIQRVELDTITQEKPYLKAKVTYLPNPNAEITTATEGMHRALLALADKMIDLAQPQLRNDLKFVLEEVKDPIHQTYLLASLLSLDVQKEMQILSADSAQELIQLVYNFYNHEVQVLDIRNKIASQVESELGKEQREYLLRKQMHAIQDELGEQRPEQTEIKDLRARMEEASLPEKVKKEVEKELNRLERMSSASPDYQITRTYVELTIELPWNKTTEDVLDLDHAQNVLDEDHYNLKDVKRRIIEHLAVMKLNPSAKAPILCFVGPPGVGKTSVGQSIARSMGRKFERMSLGGLHDEAELRGHRRTYIGAMPGRIIQSIRRAGVKNPLLMLDEVDKLGKDFRGDPAAALMEILDPAQNIEFHDNYLDLPFDLSKVFFITTANTLDSIPRPLLDRMEVLRLPGYSDEEKLQIAKRYLLPRQISEAGLSEAYIDIPDETLAYIVRRYTREAGVRELERTIGRVARKVATEVAKGHLTKTVATPDKLTDLIGPEHFFEEQIRRTLQPGVAAGLAWTEAGGDVLYVETARLQQGKDLILTGQLGAVMQESAKTAQSYIWAHADELDIDPKIIHESGIHIHVPAGAVPKDGPSAGITIVTALASLYTQLPVRSDTAMTGETTLSGLVMPVGGIREKMLAAHRAGIYRIILPEDNRKDLEELTEEVRTQMEFVFVRKIGEVLEEAIPLLREKRKKSEQGVQRARVHENALTEA